MKYHIDLKFQIFKLRYISNVQLQKIKVMFDESTLENDQF